MQSHSCPRLRCGLRQVFYSLFIFFCSFSGVGRQRGIKAWAKTFVLIGACPCGPLSAPRTGCGWSPGTDRDMLAVLQVNAWAFLKPSGGGSSLSRSLTSHDILAHPPSLFLVEPSALVACPWAGAPHFLPWQWLGPWEGHPCPSKLCASLTS